MNAITTALCLSALAFAAAPATAQCSLDLRSNWTGTASTANDVSLQRSFVIVNPEPFPIRVCSIAVKMSNGGCSSATVQFRIANDTPSGQPASTTFQSSGVVPIPGSTGIVQGTFSNLVLQPATRYHVVLDYGGNPCGLITSFVKRPATATGTSVESWAYVEQSGVQFWLRSDDNIRYRVDYAPEVRATFQEFGGSCGMPAPCNTTPFRSVNWNGNISSNTVSSGHKAFRVRDNFGYPTRFVCGLDLNMSAVGGAAIAARCSIYDESNALPGQLLTSTVVVLPAGPPTQQYVSFQSPARIGAGANYWISVEPLTGSLILPIERFGNPIASATQAANGTWTSTGTSDAYSFRNYTTTTLPQVPLLTGTPPVIGASFDVRLQNAPANAFSFLLIGWANPDSDLTVYGAPGCRGLTSGELTYWATTDGFGRATVSVPVPPSNNFLGFRFYSQYAVVSPVNALGLAFTNGGEGKVGSF